MKRVLGKFEQAMQDYAYALKLDPSSLNAYEGHEAAKREFNEAKTPNKKTHWALTRREEISQLKREAIKKSI